MKYVLSAAGYLFLNKCVLDTGVFLFPLLHEQFLWLPSSTMESHNLYESGERRWGGMGKSVQSYHGFTASS